MERLNSFAGCQGSQQFFMTNNHNLGMFLHSVTTASMSAIASFLECVILTIYLFGKIGIPVIFPL
jgi:hypothetical protein